VSTNRKKDERKPHSNVHHIVHLSSEPKDRRDEFAVIRSDADCFERQSVDRPNGGRQYTE